MKIACVLTTINVPTVLALYAKHGPDVMFFVIGDRRTPDLEVGEFERRHVPNHAYYGIDHQHKLGYKCSRLIGENSIQRRNIGFLEALKWGADIVVSIDDDNIPVSEYYFSHLRLPMLSLHRVSDGAMLDVEIKTNWWNGLKVSSPSGWFDVGTLLQPKAPHRGFPHTKKAESTFAPVVDAKIGVAAGICLGNPDVSAVDRIANSPNVTGVAEALRCGIVVDPRENWTVFNSQNSAVIRELVPAWFMIPGIGRMDDIFASLVVQRIMRQTGHYVHFGQPFVIQQRNEHNLLKDLAQEIVGMQQIERFATVLANTPLDGTVVENVRELFSAQKVLPADSVEAALAWCNDCEQVLK